jgi:hypothetical protein
MIIRNINGELIQINKYDFSCDTIYFEKIMNIKKEFTKSNQTNIYVPIKNNKKTYSNSNDIISQFITIKIVS